MPGSSDLDHLPMSLDTAHLHQRTKHRMPLLENTKLFPYTTRSAPSHRTSAQSFHLPHFSSKAFLP